jgi:hypothetical protein
MTFGFIYLAALFLGNLLYNLEQFSFGGKFGKTLNKMPSLPYPDVILNLLLLSWAAKLGSDEKTLGIFIIAHILLTIPYVIPKTKKYLFAQNIDPNSLSSTLLLGATYYTTEKLIFQVVAIWTTILFARNLISSLAYKISILEFDYRLKYFSGFFLILSVYINNDFSIIGITVFYLLIDKLIKQGFDLKHRAKRIFGTNRALPKKFIDFSNYVLLIAIFAAFSNDVGSELYVQPAILVFAFFYFFSIFFENLAPDLLGIIKPNVVLIHISDFKQVHSLDKIDGGKGLAEATYTTFILKFAKYIKFKYGFSPHVHYESDFHTIQKPIHLIFFGINLDYSHTHYKIFKRQFEVQKFIANKRNEIKTAIHISEDLEDKYDYTSNIEAYISKNHLVSAAQHSKTIKTLIVDQKLFIEDIYNKGIFDLNIMHKRNASIGDLSLRLFANLNFIEIATRFIVVLTYLEKEKELDLSNQISFGLMVSKLRDIGVASNVKHDTSGYHEIMKSALNDLKFKGKLPLKQTLIDFLNSATYIRNKTQGHGSALHISDEIWMTSELISYQILSFIYNYFGSVYFYKKCEKNLFELRSGLELKQNITIKSNEEHFIRFKNKCYKSDLLIPFQDYWYIIDSVKPGSNEFICFINGERVKPDIIEQSNS